MAIVEPFDREFARLPAERFVREILHERIDPLEVYVGYDFRFGHDREGSMRTLTELGPAPRLRGHDRARGDASAAAT